MSRDWLGYRTSKKSDKQKAIDEFEEIGIGELEQEEYTQLSTEQIDSLTQDLKQALAEVKDCDEAIIIAERIVSSLD